MTIHQLHVARRVARQLYRSAQAEHARHRDSMTRAGAEASILERERRRTLQRACVAVDVAVANAVIKRLAARLAAGKLS